MTNSDITVKTIMRPSQIFLYDGETYPSMEEAEKARGRKSDFFKLMARFEMQSYRRNEKHRTLPFSDYCRLQGVWHITDEGPVDFGSSARPKTLAYVEGTFEQAARHALTLPDFKGYDFGYIEWIEIVKL